MLYLQGRIMPIYEYRCESCDNEFEKLLRAGQDEPTQCPACDAEALNRLISNTSFKLEGSGWYETDYARAGESSEEKPPEGGGDAAGGDVSGETAQSDDDADEGSKTP